MHRKTEQNHRLSQGGLFKNNRSNQCYFALMLGLVMGLAIGCGNREPTREPMKGPTGSVSNNVTGAPSAEGNNSGAEGSKIMEEKIVFHKVRVDQRGLLLSWNTEESPYDWVITKAWGALRNAPTDDNGYKPYYAASIFSNAPGKPMKGSQGWIHHPGGLAAMFIDSGITLRQYTGDDGALDDFLPFLDYVIANGMTKETDSWSKVAYACSNGGALKYEGADDKLYCDDHKSCGAGDGVGYLEPDKVAEFGYALARLYEVRGEEKYLNIAINAANQLVKHVRKGNEKMSPWPFRVDAKTGTKVRDEYSANVLGAILLFDRLITLQKGAVADYEKTRKEALQWLFEYPIKNELWDGYFEDIDNQKLGKNANQYTPLETARYLLEHPEVDPEYKQHVEKILAFVTKVFTVDSHDGTFEKGNQYGAEVMSEQIRDMAKMGSHTARFASVLALNHEKTGDTKSKERALRSLNWATYVCDDNGIVKVGENDREGYWFSDGYGDYVRHFVAAMASEPEWAPSKEAIILRSSAEITKQKKSPSRLEYTATRASGVERVRLPKEPTSVIVNNKPLSKTREGEKAAAGYRVITLAKGVAVDITREQMGNVVIEW